MSYKEAAEYFNKETKRSTQQSGGVRVSYLKIPENTAALLTVLSDDFVQTTVGGVDIAGNPVKYAGFQVIVRDDTDGKEKVWNVPRAVGKKLVEEMTKLNLQSPRDFTIKAKHVDQYNYETEVLKTPNGTATAESSTITDVVLTEAEKALRQFNGTMGDAKGVGIILKVRMGLKTPEVGKEVVEELMKRGKVSFDKGRLLVK